jgi:hypothetical protein
VNASGSANKDSGATAADDKMAERKLPWFRGDLSLVLMGGEEVCEAFAFLAKPGQFGRT